MTAVSTNVERNIKTGFSFHCSKYSAGRSGSKLLSVIHTSRRIWTAYSLQRTAYCIIMQDQRDYLKLHTLTHTHTHTLITALWHMIAGAIWI